jgi:hypothetical protein
MGLYIGGTICSKHLSISYNYVNLRIGFDQWYDIRVIGPNGEQSLEVKGKAWCKSNAVPQL